MLFETFVHRLRNKSGTRDKRIFQPLVLILRLLYVFARQNAELILETF